MKRLLLALLLSACEVQSEQRECRLIDLTCAKFDRWQIVECIDDIDGYCVYRNGRNYYTTAIKNISASACEALNYLEVQNEK